MNFVFTAALIQLPNDFVLSIQGLIEADQYYNRYFHKKRPDSGIIISFFRYYHEFLLNSTLFGYFETVVAEFHLRLVYSFKIITFLD